MDALPTDSSFVVSGMLQPDGMVRLDHPLGILPGPIEVTIRPLLPQRERLPDHPIDDPTASPPFDLPRNGTTRAVQPVRVLDRLPDPLQNAEVA